jgi:O-antigen/teichoic acid export membrane protein
LTLVVAAVAGVGGLALFLLTIRRPIFGCAALLLTVPLTAGLARGSIIPVLKPSEGILLIVAVGVVAHNFTVPRSRPVTGLDLAVGGYVIGSVVIPWIVLLLTRYPADIATWQTVLSPILFLFVYYLFSRTHLTDRGFRIVINSALVSGVIVSLIAAAELANLPGVRTFFAAFYTGEVLASYRPSSTLGHYSAVGGFGLLTYTIALALATVRHTGFRGWWLTVVMCTSLLGVIVSETWAPLAILPLATALVLLYGRHIPRELVVTLVIGAVALVFLLPLISGRIESQHLISAQGFALPESMQTRIRYWNEFIIPALSDNIWAGTGTVIPSSVPGKLTAYVDNEYLWAAFRAGLAGVALLVGMLLAILVAGQRQRFNLDASRRAIGASALTTAAMLILLGATAQYITFAGLSQEIAMLVGVLGALTTEVRTRRVPVLVIAPRVEPLWAAIPRSIEATIVQLRQLKPESGLLRSSAVVFAGFATARALGFLFSVAAARIMFPLDYGRLMYAIAVVTIASVFISSAPVGLSRFLSRNHLDRSVQDSYFTNWITLIGLIVMISAVFVTPIALLLGLQGWLLVGVLCNLLGIAALEGYREVQRGQNRFLAMMAVYVIANLIQLVAILILGYRGITSAAPFLIVYGLSSVAALAVMLPLVPVSLKFRVQDVASQRIREIFRFIRPLLLQSVFFAVWFSSDLVIVQHLMRPEATGNYAVAKAFVNVLLLVPTAIGAAVLPRVARLVEQSSGRFMVTALGLTATASIPLVAGAALLGPRLVVILFGAKYPDAAGPVPILALGMGLYGFCSVMGSIWVGLGRPGIDSVATGVAMTCTVGAALALVPHLGLEGAAIAFTAGAAARLLVIGTFTLRTFASHRAREQTLTLSANPNV